MSDPLDVPAGTIFLSSGDLGWEAVVTVLGQALAGRGRASRFTHSWLSLGDGFAVGSAVDEGIFIAPLEPDDVAPEVYQLPPPGGALSAFMVARLWDEAQRLSGTPYDHVAAALSVLPPWAFRARRTRTVAPFCSALVAHLLAHVSHPASPRPSHSMTPADLFRGARPRV